MNINHISGIQVPIVQNEPHTLPMPSILKDTIAAVALSVFSLAMANSIERSFPVAALFFRVVVPVFLGFSWLMARFSGKSTSSSVSSASSVNHTYVHHQNSPRGFMHTNNSSRIDNRFNTVPVITPIVIPARPPLTTIINGPSILANINVPVQSQPHGRIPNVERRNNSSSSSQVFHLLRTEGVALPQVNSTTAHIGEIRGSVNASFARPVAPLAAGPIPVARPQVSSTRAHIGEIRRSVSDSSALPPSYAEATESIPPVKPPVSSTEAHTGEVRRSANGSFGTPSFSSSTGRTVPTRPPVSSIAAHTGARIMGSNSFNIPPQRRGA